MKKKSSSQSAFFNFRVLLFLCLGGALLALAALGALPGAPGESQRSATQTQTAQAPQASNNNDNNASPPASGMLPGQRASNSTFSLMEAPGSSGDTVTTDKPDYVPGETVVISGSLWIPNVAVALHIDDSNNVARWDSSAIADGQGNISNSEFVIQPQDVGLAFTLTATQGAVTAFTQFTDVVGPGLAPNGDPGGFEIDAASSPPPNLRATTNSVTDWLDLTPLVGTGSGLLFDSSAVKPTSPIVTFRSTDAYNSGDDVFAESNKVNADPNTYHWKTASSGDKTDIDNVYVHISKSVVGGADHTWITASGDRLSNNGTSYIDFELSQAEITKVTDTGCSSAPCGHFVTSPLNASTGGRTVNDLLITANYGSGGSLATMLIAQWKQVSPNTYDWVDITPFIPANTAFVATNTAAGLPVPYGAFGGTSYLQNQFVEMSVDVTALIAAAIDRCVGIEVKSVFVKTKTAVAFNASLDDFVSPISTTFSAGFVASSSNTAIACNGGLSTVTVSASGGTGSYTGTGTFSHAAGRYSYTVTDANSCTATTTGNITQPSAVAASSSNSAILCHGGNSTVTVSATGGTPGYTGTGTFSHAAGTYSYTVTDAHSCPATTTGTIADQPAVVASSSNTAILCHGGNSIVTVSATGGTGSYNGTGTFSHAAGTYSYTVTDANSCTSTTTGDITQPSSVVASSSNTAILCHGGNSIVTVSATGGTGSYSGTGTFSVPAGTYSYTVTDANSCTSTTTGDITQPSAVTADSSNSAILCNGGNSTVTVTAGGGTGPYTGDGTFSHAAGTYSYTVTDHNGCTSTTTGTITEPSAITASSSYTAIACHGGSSTVTVSASGGTSPYTGTGTFSHGAGTYSYTVADSEGCTANTTGDITEPSAITASSTYTAIACHGGSSTVTVSTSGGTSPYTGTGTFSHGAGTYSYTVADSEGCTANTTGNITEPSAITLS